MGNELAGGQIQTVWINGRFLSRPVTGVERVALEIIGELADNVLDESGHLSKSGVTYQFRVIVPGRIECESPWSNIPICRFGRLKGHLWEQIELPFKTAGDTLLSLCNTGPLFKREHHLFLHDAQVFAIPKNFSWAFRNYYKLLFHVGGRIAKRVLVNSEFTRSELISYVGLPYEKMTLCRLGGDHVLRTEVADEVLDKFDLPEGDFMLAVSSANPNKNFPFVAKALESLGPRAPDCVIVGQSGQSHFADVKVDSDKIHALGYVSDEELLALYSRATCLVFPSIYEGFGLPPLEAMALGCPVISSQTSSMPEVGGDAALYCDPFDVESLSEAIETVFGSDQVQQERSERGRKRAEMFSWQKTGAALIQSIGV